MYICGSCRVAAVSTMEPGLVCVLQRGPFDDFSLNIFTSVGWDIYLYLMIMGKVLVEWHSFAC